MITIHIDILLDNSVIAYIGFNESVKHVKSSFKVSFSRRLVWLYNMKITHTIHTTSLKINVLSENFLIDLTSFETS